MGLGGVRDERGGGGSVLGVNIDVPPSAKIKSTLGG